MSVFAIFSPSYAHDMITIVLSFALCMLRVLLSRLDDKHLDAHDNDARPGHPSISGVVESYGHFPAAIIYATVEIVACFRFALIHRLQGSRRHLLPVVKRRTRATLHTAFNNTICWATSLLRRLSGTAGGATVAKRLAAPYALVLDGCHEDLCLLFGNGCVEVTFDYLLVLLGQSFSRLTGVVDKVLDSIARRSHRSTLLWMVYMPIATWFAFALCSVSIALAFISPYTFYTDVTPQIVSAQIAKETAQPPSLRDAADDRECTMSAAYESQGPAKIDSIYLPEPTNTSILHLAIEESASLDLSTLLADMDPHADVSTLISLEMKFIPEIYVTAADQSTPFSCLSGDLFDISLGHAMLDEVSNVDEDASQDDVLLPVEDAITTTTTIEAADTVLHVRDGYVAEGTEQLLEDAQVDNAEAGFTDSEAELLATLLLQLEARDASGAFRPYLDDSALTQRQTTAPVSPRASEATEARDIFDRFMDYQAPHLAPSGSKLYAMDQHRTPEVVIMEDDSLWYASAKAGAAAAILHTKPSPMPPRPAPSVPTHTRTEGAENRPQLAYWRPGRGGAIPIVAPPLSRRRRAALGLGSALATGDKRKDYLTHRALS